ncbi:SDR family NAD(P)-dependent oxidoreductase [Bacillus hwajinpoensis]|uniref:SDR family NAD(P)-dependent oxidoreductase n=1 Tax=Guptibacillus hwajinpoensis TaxID=208199 RepID=A0A845EZR8_9BACL|nr:3-hydroxyacyl-CoA dehydrogenase [Pseudalkalibacillus hwajinpoensis]MYL64172.1 SDR family NAD(P)-dependent oxidoreductase [Pseudalkalibacillus hwajinpoensis]
MNNQYTTAVVTGGASGLGEASVRTLLTNNFNVAIFDLSKSENKNLLEEFPLKLKYYQTDITNEELIKTSMENVVENFGSIDVVVNCAGIGPPNKVLDRNLIPHDLTAFTNVISVNLIGTFNVIRIASQYIAENTPSELGERGIIINTASIAAFDGQIGQAAYSASKGGIVAMTLPIARELARYGIRVMTIAPGLFETPMFDTLSEEVRQSLGSSVPFPSRLGKPEEFAQLVLSIIENPMLNGETIRLDGAIRMQPK